MVEELKVIIKAELDKFKKGLDEGKKQTKSFKDQIKDAGKDIDETFKSAGDSIKNGIKAGVTAAAASLAALGVALVGISSSTAEYRNNQAKLNAAFETAGISAAVATDTYNDLYRVLGDDGTAVEAANHLAKLTDNQQDLEQWTTICQGVYATFGDSIPIEGLTEAANETAKVGTLTGSLADALNWAGVSEDAFNESLAACNNEAEREALIRDTLNGIYSEAAANYETTAAETLAQNEAQAKLTDSLAKIGKAIAPVITAFTEFAANALAKVTPYIQDIAAKYGPMLKDVLSATAKAVKAAFGFFVDNWKIFAGIAGVIAGITAAIGLYNTVAAIKAAMDAAQVTTVWGLVTAHIAQAAAAMAALAPYLLIVAAIAAVIAIIVLCIVYWDEIVAAVKAAWEWIANLLSTVATWIYDNVIAPVAQFFTDLWDGIIGGIVAAWEWVVNLFSTVATWIYDNVIAPIANFFTGLWEGIVNAYHTVIDPWIEIFTRIAAIVDEKIIQPVKQFFTKLWEDIKAVFSAAANWFNNTVIQPIVKFFTALWEGVVSLATGAWNGIKNAFSAAANWFNNTVIQPLKKFFTGVWDAITNGAKNAWNGVKSVFSTVANFFGNIFSAAWEKVKAVFSVGGKIFDGIKDGIVTAFKTVVNAIIRGINKVIALPFKGLNDILDTIHGISIVGVEPFSWLTWRAPVPQIPELAKGGVLKQGQIGLLEGNGAEAVVPLEKNTGWLDKIAERLVAGMGANGTPIVLQVDGKTFAETSITTINQLTKQTGKLALNIY